MPIPAELSPADRAQHRSLHGDQGPGDRKVLASRRVDNTPEATVGIDMLGGIAALLEAMLLDADVSVVHVPGLAVNRARRATTGGGTRATERRHLIADQVRMRDDLRPVTALRGLDVELRLLGRSASEIVADQTRRAVRLRDLLISIHPGLERVVDVTTKTGLHLLTRYTTPDQIRTAC